MNNETVALIALSDAPEHIAKELKATKKKDGLLSELSPEAQEWIENNAVNKDRVMLDEVVSHYMHTLGVLETMVHGIYALGKVMDQEKADQMNLDVYNACAEFCREYNANKML